MTNKWNNSKRSIEFQRQLKKKVKYKKNKNYINDRKKARYFYQVETICDWNKLGSVK